MPPRIRTGNPNNINTLVPQGNRNGRREIAFGGNPNSGNMRRKKPSILSKSPISTTMNKPAVSKKPLAPNNNLATTPGFQDPAPTNVSPMTDKQRAELRKKAATGHLY